MSWKMFFLALSLAVVVFLKGHTHEWHTLEAAFIQEGTRVSNT